MVVDAVSKPLELDRRELVPPTGLREFWYPALLAKKVGRKPVKMRLLGEELCFFRDEDGKVAAAHDGVDLSKLPKDKWWWDAK